MSNFTTTNCFTVRAAVSEAGSAVLPCGVAAREALLRISAGASMRGQVRDDLRRRLLARGCQTGVDKVAAPIQPRGKSAVGAEVLVLLGAEALGGVTGAEPFPAHLQPFWHEFAQSAGRVGEACIYEAFSFGDSEALANELGELVLRGAKQATAGSAWSFEARGRRLPAARDLSIVTNWARQPLALIETQPAEVLPFGEVGAAFAAAEGEGDGSLSFWREAHRRYFTRECAAAGRVFNESLLVACEHFVVVFRRSCAG